MKVTCRTASVIFPLTHLASPAFPDHPLEKNISISLTYDIKKIKNKKVTLLVYAESWTTTEEIEKDFEITTTSQMETWIDQEKKYCIKL